MTNERFDVWFSDDGRWELDVVAVNRATADSAIAELRSTGYLQAVAVPTGTGRPEARCLPTTEGPELWAGARS